MAEPIPDDLRDFILRYISSVAHIEALLLLRADPGMSWDGIRMAGRLYCSEQNADAVLEDLRDGGFVVGEGGAFSYGCQSEELASMVERLASAYSTHLIPITNIIHSRPRRIREFADAFKFRKGR